MFYESQSFTKHNNQLLGWRMQISRCITKFSSLSLMTDCMSVCSWWLNNYIISINHIHTIMWPNKSLSVGKSSINRTLCNVQVFTCLHLASETTLLAHSMLHSPTTNSPLRYIILNNPCLRTSFLLLVLILLLSAHRPPVEQPCIMSHFNKTIYSTSSKKEWSVVPPAM